MKYIEVVRAKQNNLKNISVNIPLGKITAICGVSGSGKSSLIYGVLASEALRREKNDSGHANLASLCLKADVEEIRNLPYCEVLKQRRVRETVSSSIATISGLHEFLRDEFVRNGKIIGKNGVINKPSVDQILLFLKKFRKKNGGRLYAQLCENKIGQLDDEIKLLQEYNISRVLYKNTNGYAGQKTIKDLTKMTNGCHSILVEIDDLKSVERFEKLAKIGFVFESSNEILNFCRDFPDLKNGILYSKPSSRLFSFNSTDKESGRCEYCNGRGYVEDISKSGLFSNRPLFNIDFVNLPFDNNKGYYKYILLGFKTIQHECKKYGIDTNKNFFELDSFGQEVITNLFLPRMLKHKNKKLINVLLCTKTCSMCNGSRLNYKANAVKLFGKSISEILELNILQALDFFGNKVLYHKKIIDILNNLKNATLGYLSLNRTTDTLSGGELQRLKLALALQSQYNRLLYILDEPSNGLHPYNNAQMINLLKHIVAQNNTIVLCEHDEEYLKHSDHIIKLGYGSGGEGGKVVYEGAYQNFCSNIDFIRKKNKVNLQHAIYLEGVSFNNIQNQNFVIPLYSLVVISGVSGSGKSSLVNGVIQPLCTQFLESKSINYSLVKKASGLENIKYFTNLSQKQTTANIRSIVATFLEVFDELRELFSCANNGVKTSFFSFNAKDGQCDECRGHGEINESLCPTCLGHGFKTEVLEMFFNEKNIVEVLELNMEDLSSFFKDNEKFSYLSEVLSRLGLSHLSLGRRLDGLSGGELQRLALAKEFIRNKKKLKEGGVLFILDEPTRGLDSENIIKMIKILDEFIAMGNSVIVIEHNSSLIKSCDFIIDLGIGSGTLGGKNIFSGEVEELKKSKESITAKVLFGTPPTEHVELYRNKNLKPKIYTFNKEMYPFRKFLLDDDHFANERELAKNYMILSEENIHHFKTKDELFNFAKSLQIKQVFFNPLSQWLYKYKIVPHSIKKQVFKKYKIIEGDNFLCKTPCDSIEQAYQYGLGWISVKLENNSNLVLGTRLVSLKHNILGGRVITPEYFSLYVNGCKYCQGSGKLFAYDASLFVNDWNRSIFDQTFFSIPLKLKLRTIISRFKSEGLFDFEVPFNMLSQEQKDIFLYGFREYKFLKVGGRENALGDYLMWNGLFSIIYENLWQINKAEQIRASKHEVKCPFCNDGFKKEIAFYYQK